ncbi:MAG: BrnT family toxin [Elusimicrobiota bacterium]
MYHIHTSALEFEWNQLKERWNRKKHGVTFEEAADAFMDRHAGLYFDPDHSQAEDRFLLVGTSTKGRVLIVNHCYRKDGTRIRIISARKATSFEIVEYFEGAK